ncbi:MAG: FmdB family transcriptional regulator [Candidatus Marinimicrobia bacterium]|nr:FmdB family transcriptional regulator [Candidatus Neomarinimicrobiota bacterium]|tara:strand:+ start:567 stop:839 length:273 start_codon:yes stop_codon:yes gene_type:complete
MPTYDYICRTCDERFEHFQTISSQPLTKRPDCQEKKCAVKRLISGGTGLIFKGSGFYLTDYKNKKQTEKKKKSDKKEGNEPKKKSKESAV